MIVRGDVALGEGAAIAGEGENLLLEPDPTATVSGSGRVEGGVVVAHTATIAPGASVGELDVANATLGIRGRYVWEISDATGLPGIGMDHLAISGELTMTSTPAAPFVVRVVSVDDAGEPAPADNFDGGTPYLWRIASAAAITGFARNRITLDLAEFIAVNPQAANGEFTVAPSGTAFIIRYQPGPAPEPLTLVGAASRRTHGQAGTFDIDLPLDEAAAAVENRIGGPSQIGLTFSQDVAADDDTPDCSEITLSAGTCIDLGISGREVIIDLVGLPAGTCVSLVVVGVETTDGHPLVGDDNVHVRILPGDVSGDGIVDVLDMSRVKGDLFTTPAPASFRADINRDGEIDVLDMSAVKGHLFRSASCP